MPHPEVVPHDDPGLVRIRELALALPGAKEKLSVGHPAFYTTKVFVWFGMSHKHQGEWIHGPRTVAFLLPEPEHEAVMAQPNSFKPAYIGPYGWVGITLDDDTDWDEIAELVEESYRQTAGKKLIAQLDAQRS